MFKLKFGSLFLLAIILSSQAEAQLRPFALRKRPVAQTLQTVVLTTAGASTWTVPAGVTSLISIEVWGGGGGTSSYFGDGYGGAGGGAYSKKNNYAVTAGAVINYTIGAGGTSPQNANGTDGGDTWFVNSTTVMAKGGKAGPRDDSTWLGGAGGASASGYGDVKYSGGNGGTADNQGGGAGGAAASPTGNGANGGNSLGSAGGTGGASPGGGAGGAGGATGNPPTAGTAGTSNQNGGGGGGGGGGRNGGSGGGALGGAGGVPGGGVGAQGGNWNGVGVANNSGGSGQIILKFMQ